MRSAAPLPSEWETRYVFADCRAEMSDARTIVGYGITFNVKSLDLGGFREIIKPSAVDRTLREGLDVRSYINHDPNRIIGRSSAGTLSMRKEQRGLRVEITPPDTSYAKDLIKSIRRGDISGMSFRFRALTDDWRMENGEAIREVSDMTIGEIGPVTEPAYVQTEVAVRSLLAFQETLRTGPSRDLYERRLKAAGIR